MPNAVLIKVHRLLPAAVLPKYAHTGPWGDLAADLCAAASITVAPGETAVISTGVAIELPAEYGALVEDRSGLAARGITTLAGVIDPGYRGEIKVVISNLGPAELRIASGDRIAQLRVVARIEATFEEAGELADTPRGTLGFGSTGR